MPRNTIQIRLMRIRISDHSAGCSSTKRVRIWNTPRLAAMAIMAQATSMAKPVAQRSKRRKAFFKRLFVIADLVDVRLAELLFELDVHGGERGDELALVHVLDHLHALAAQFGHALGIVLVHARAIDLDGLLGGI